MLWQVGSDRPRKKVLGTGVSHRIPMANAADGLGTRLLLRRLRSRPDLNVLACSRASRSAEGDDAGGNPAGEGGGGRGGAGRPALAHDK